MDTSEQRLRHQAHRGTAEAAREECRHRFVGRFRTWDERLECDPRPRQWRQQAVSDDAAGRCGDAEHGGGGNRVEATALQDEGGPGPPRRDDVSGETQLAEKIERSALLGEDRVGARLDREAVQVFGPDQAAQPTGSLEEDERHPAQRQLEGRGQARDAASNHRYQCSRRQCPTTRGQGPIVPRPTANVAELDLARVIFSAIWQLVVIRLVRAASRRARAPRGPARRRATSGAARRARG